MRVGERRRQRIVPRSGRTRVQARRPHPPAGQSALCGRLRSICRVGTLSHLTSAGCSWRTRRSPRRRTASRRLPRSRARRHPVHLVPVRVGVQPAEGRRRCDAGHSAPAIEHGMVLKDASAYNIQFVGRRPMLIDTLSFERWSRERRGWPTASSASTSSGRSALMSADRRPARRNLSRTFIDGPPLDLVSRLLPVTSSFTPRCWCICTCTRERRRSTAARHCASGGRRPVHAARHARAWSITSSRRSSGSPEGGRQPRGPTTTPTQLLGRGDGREAPLGDGAPPAQPIDRVGLWRQHRRVQQAGGRCRRLHARPGWRPRRRRAQQSSPDRRTTSDGSFRS